MFISQGASLLLGHTYISYRISLFLKLSLFSFAYVSSPSSAIEFYCWKYVSLLRAVRTILSPLLSLSLSIHRICITSDRPFYDLCVYFRSGGFISCASTQHFVCSFDEIKYNSVLIDNMVNPQCKR